MANRVSDASGKIFPIAASPGRELPYKADIFLPMKIPLLLVALALAGTTVSINAVDVVQRPLGVTTLTLGNDVANGIVAAAAGSRVTVPYYEQVRLKAPDGWPYAIQWTKDGKAIEGATEATLVLPFVTPSDSGLYNLTGAPWPTITTGIKLTVAPAERLANLSTRQELPAGDSVVIVGFVVSGEKAKSLLVRAVGPSLRDFGVTRPVALPRMKFFDAKGTELEWSHVAMIIDWAPIFASVGAFPLTGGEREWTAYTTVSLPPGAYSVHVSDDAKAGGTVLAEVYEMP